MTDFHLHSNFSDDGRATAEEMTLAEIEKGVRRICFTDHVEDCNLGEPVGYEVDSFEEKRESYFSTIAQLKERFRGTIEIGTGIEVSGINHDPEKAAQLASADGLDFIIGSVHNNRGQADFFGFPYESEAQCRRIIEDYLTEHFELVKCGCCDVVGHIGYPLNHMLERGFGISLFDYYDQMRELLRRIVESGIGIEINTSGLRRRIKETAPAPGFVKLYRELGGEIITVGSDGHDASQAGFGLEQGFKILRDAGFKYVTVFEKRKPEFIKI